MKTCYVYSSIAPPPEDFVDNKSIPPLLTIPVELKDGRQWEIAILGPPHEIRAVRISMPETEGPTINPEDYKRYLKLRLFALDCIRINYDPSIEYFRRDDTVFSMHNFIEADVGPSMAMKITQPLNFDFRVNAEGLKVLLAAPPEMRVIVRLLADGSDYRLPIQFRFLSFYKIIELHFKVTTNKPFNAFIEPFIKQFQEIYPDVRTVAQLFGVLSKLRNRCAHIELTTGDLGFSHPEAEREELYKFLPVLKRVAIKCIRLKFPGSPLRFAATPEESAAEFAEMERDGLKPISGSG